MRLCHASLFVLGLLGLVVLSSAFSSHALASTPPLGLVVTKTADTNDGTCDSDCSLREAITAANALTGANTITFDIPASDAGCTSANVCTTTQSGFMTLINDDLTIDGSANNGDITVDGNDGSRPFTINSGKNVTLNTLTITRGRGSNDTSGNGFPGTVGGISNSGILTLIHSTLTGNTGGDGGHSALFIAGNGGPGAIQNDGTMVIIDSTLTNNRGGNGGETGAVVGGPNGGTGAIENNGTLTVINSTVAGNFGGNPGTSNLGPPGRFGFGGISNFATLSLQNTILANNWGTANCGLGVPLTVESHNLADDNSCGSATVKTTAQIALGPLQNNGGTTDTMALANASSAIDAGDNAVCADTNTVNNLDQRGKPRNDLNCDLGAFEYVAADGTSIAKTGLTDGETQSFGPTLAKIQFVSGTPLSLTIDLVPGAPGNTPPADALPLTWDMPAPCFMCRQAPEAANAFSLNVTFCYDTGILSGQDESKLRVYRLNGATWDNLGGTPDNTNHLPYHCVTATNPVTTLSTFVLAPDAPTAVDVTGVKGALNKQGNIAVRWRTQTEAHIAGFNIYRRVNSGAWKQANAAFKQAKHAGEVAGDKYRFTDKPLARGKTYRYKIEIVYLDGQRAWSDVIRVVTK